MGDNLTPSRTYGAISMMLATFATYTTAKGSTPYISAMAATLAIGTATATAWLMEHPGCDYFRRFLRYI